MTRDEAKQVVFMIAAAYPNFHPLDMKMTVDVWASIMGEYPAAEVKKAAQTYIATDTKGFAPSPGQVIALMHVADDYSYPPEMEAWTMVRKAISDGAYHSEKQYNALPEIIQRAVGSAGQIQNWAMTDIDSVETVVQSNFLRAYRAAVESEKKYKSLPGYQRAAIDAKKATQIMIESKPEKAIPIIDRKTAKPDPDSKYRALVDSIMKSCTA